MQYNDVKQNLALIGRFKAKVDDAKSELESRRNELENLQSITLDALRKELIGKYIKLNDGTVGYIENVPTLSKITFAVVTTTTNKKLVLTRNRIDIVELDLDSAVEITQEEFLMLTATELILPFIKTNLESVSPEQSGYDGLSHSELRESCDLRGIEITPKTTRGELIALLESYDFTPTEPIVPDDDYDVWTYMDLFAKCKCLGLVRSDTDYLLSTLKSKLRYYNKHHNYDSMSLEYIRKECESRKVPFSLSDAKGVLINRLREQDIVNNRTRLGV